MAGKSILPILLAAGAGAVLLSKKKKPASKKKAAVNGNGVVASGKVDRTSIPKGPGDSSLAYEWRVRKGDGVFISETGRPATLRDLEVKTWKAIGEADTVEDAKDMALAWIDEQPGYESEAEIVDSGAKDVWEWRVITDPERGYIGQYRLSGGQWLGAVEGAEYTEQFKLAIWEVAIKDYNAKQAKGG